jgi:hypothetical protein
MSGREPLGAFYFDYARGQGVGHAWAYGGIPLGASAAPSAEASEGQTRCPMCHEFDCGVRRSRSYDDGVWYLGLGTPSRFPDVIDRPHDIQNAICFVRESAVMSDGPGRQVPGV